ncbi:hypothetical protein [Desulfitobacterium chlororespirans]|uniref:Uncharacterized protein n=1 Tax=Desulfitobacterium chlororespirans DSM 11544 TaxID=1121395 RepID=A0A1M7RT19_9FIRM|nr:hypothetical protein [Desulfitobacterium chlororespirans]SHN49238.1 hypothetical protein SAMN02745215_00044 [Desulfitobacterium chlororespirans DSM 11544]
MNKKVRHYSTVILLGVVLGIVIAILKNYVGLDIDVIQLLLYLYVILAICGVTFYLYVAAYTKNINLVDRYVQRKSDHPYYALLLSLVKKDYQEAEIQLERLSSLYKQAKIALTATVQIEKNLLREAEATVQEIRNSNIRYHNLALIALLQGNLEEFEAYKARIKHKYLHYALEAEAAYREKDYKKADELAELAISSAGGLQKWVYVKSLERQKGNTQRRSYF